MNGIVFPIIRDEDMAYELKLARDKYPKVFENFMAWAIYHPLFSRYLSNWTPSDKGWYACKFDYTYFVALLNGYFNLFNLDYGPSSFNDLEKKLKLIHQKLNNYEQSIYFR